MPPDAASGHRSTPGIAAAGPLSRLLRAPDVRAEPGALRDAAAHHRRGYFTGFSPAISTRAKKAKGKQIRDWHLNRRSGTDLFSLALFALAAWGVFRSKGWWERAASAGAIVGLATLVPYWIAASSTPEPGLNKPIHIAGSAAVLIVLLVPALERRLKAWLSGEHRPWRQ